MKNSKHNNIKKVLIFLSLALLIVSSYFIYTLRQKKSPEPETPKTDSDIRGVTANLVVLPKVQQIWWDLNWKSSQRINIANLTNGSINASKPASFTFNHKELVKSSKSKEDGTDLQIIYQNAFGETKPLEFVIENLGEENTEIYFDLGESIPANTQISNYFLYYNNSTAKENKFLKLNGLKSYNNNLRIEVEKELVSPFNFTFNRKWILKGKNLPVDYQKLEGSININNDFNSPTTNFSWKIEGTSLASIPTPLPSGNNPISINPSELQPGKYALKLDFADHKASYEFIVSYPLYTTWTMDWEGMDVKDEYLKYIDTIAVDNKMPITHFFSPRIYVLASMSPERRQYLTNWVKNRQAKYGDSIDMHLHMHHDFVEKAGITPKKDVSWSGFKDGYDVPTTVYSEEELEKIVGYGLQLFEQNGLKKPIGYRAGGWHIKAEGLRAIEKLGFKYDSSGRESFSFGKNNLSVPWNLKSTSEPYQISLSDQNSGQGPTMKLWEFPNNGSDSTNYPVTEMLNKFKDNFNGEPLKKKQVLTFLSHPQWFSEDKSRMEELFRETNKYLAKDGNGPIVYTTLDDVYTVWTQN